MGQRSGLGAQVGIRKEETYGTYKAPNRFLPFTSESLALSKEFQKPKGLVAGRMVQQQRLHKGTTRSAGGDLNFELFDQGMGAIFDLFHGDVVAPAKVGESAAYKQLHKIGLTPPWGKSATVQVGRPDTATGTTQPFSYLGCKGITLKISIEAGGLATFTLTVDAQDEVTDQALAAATYDADALPYGFQDMAVLLGGEPAGNVLSLNLTITVPQKTDRMFLGNSGLKAQPIANDLVTIQGDANLEFASLADHDRYKKEEVVALALNATGDEIDGENNMEANFKITAAKQVSSSPQVNGPDVLTSSVTFEGLDNGTDAPFEAELISTDTAL